MQNTSRATLDSLSPTRAAEDREIIRNFLLGRGEYGAIDEEIQDSLDMDGNTERPRRGDLVTLGRAEDSGRTRPTKSGRPAIIWVATHHSKWRDVAIPDPPAESAAPVQSRPEQQPINTTAATGVSAMKIMVRHFRGIERADLEANPVALIAGQNFQGKSSICQAVAAALTGETIPFIKPAPAAGEFASLIAKKSAGALVRAGASKGGVLIKIDAENWAGVEWPNSELSTKGKAPRASVFAAGLYPIMDLDDKRRSAFFSDLIGANPKVDDLANFLKDHSLDRPKLIDNIWKRITDDGWDEIFKAAREHGAKMKGQWEGVTHEKYGVAKGIDWIPSDWDSDLETASLDGLNGALADAKDTLETAVGDLAVDRAEIARLSAIANEALPEIKTFEENVRDALNRLDTAKATLAELGPVTHDRRPVILKCAHCGEENVLVGVPGNYTLNRPGKKPNKAAVEKEAKERAAAEKVLREADEIYRGEKGDLSALLDRYQVRDAAKRDLEIAESKGGSAMAVDAAREAVRIAEERIRKFESWTKAGRLHKSIADNQHIIDALAPDGVRKTALIRALEFLNDELRELSTAAKWPLVRVDEGMGATLNSREYILLSDSERFMVNTVLQLAAAKFDSSSMVVIDSADIIVGDRLRNGLMEMIRAWGGNALIAMTISVPKNMPDLSKVGMGSSYWIETGLCVSPPVQ